MPQADPWRSLDDMMIFNHFLTSKWSQLPVFRNIEPTNPMCRSRARDKKRSVAHEMEHHIRLLVGHIVGIGQPGNEITTSGQDVLKKRSPKKTGSYKCLQQLYIGVHT